MKASKSINLYSILVIICSILGGIIFTLLYSSNWQSFFLYFSLIAVSIFSILYSFLIFFHKETQLNADYGSAHWATPHEIKETGLLSDSGIIIGAIKEGKKLKILRHNGEGHVIVVSPTRSGKGVSVVVPAALTWEESVIFNDIKGELWELTSGWRRKHFNSVCLKFDATSLDSTTAKWNPLLEVRPYPQDTRDAQNIALTLCSTDSKGSRSDNERHWQVMGTRLIKAAILHQLYAGSDKTLPGCYKLLTASSRSIEETFKLMLSALHDKKGEFNWQDSESGKTSTTHPVVASIARDMLSKSDRERSSIVSSAISYLEPFDDPIMASNVSSSDFSLADLMHNEKPVSLYLTTPVADLERVKSLHRLFFTLACTRNTEHLEFDCGQPKAKYKHRLLEVFDECAHLGYFPIIPKHFSLASGYGIRGLFVFQDFSQIFELYGRNESITSNCDIKIAFAPNNLETAKYLSNLLGVETRTKKEDGSLKNFLGKGQKPFKQTFARPLFTADECLRLDKDKSIILKNGAPPILGTKLPYFKIPGLLERSKIPATRSDKLVKKEQTYWGNLAESKKQNLKAKVVSKKVRSFSKKNSKKLSEVKQIELFPIST